MIDPLAMLGTQPLNGLNRHACNTATEFSPTSAEKLPGCSQHDWHLVDYQANSIVV